MLSEGDRVPEVNLATDDGETLSLSSLKGQPVVLYFYPKDDTPGCTNEAKDFSAMLADFEKAGALVIGVSPDSAKKHAKFRQKHALQIKLASDEDKAVTEAFGSWTEKSLYGRKYMGVDRSTFLIDKAGKIARIWRKVKVAGHAAEVLAAVKSMKK